MKAIPARVHAHGTEFFARSARLACASLAASWSLALAAPCDPPVTNPIACENTKAGNPSSEWDLPAPNGGDSTIQGFATDISVNHGQTISFKVKTTATNYHIDVYRLGYYGGMGARKIVTVNPSVSLPQTQPSCITQPSVGLIDCGNWAVSANWSVPSTAVSGVYLAKLVRPDTGGSSHMIFVVRDDTGHSDILLQTSDTTWVAYNMYGGASLYRDHTFSLPAGRAYKVSYNRPFITRTGINGDSTLDPSWIFDSEHPMIRWLEANGYNLSYTTGVDTARRPSELLEHDVFVSSGHDEYWSAPQRASVEAARAAGVHLAFFSGNEVFWKTRWENSVDGSNTAYRTIACYKETHANAVIDPQDPPTWTGTWRDPRFSPPADGGLPENALTGTLFMVNGPVNHTITVPAEYGSLRFWRNTSIATLPQGQTATLSAGTLGYEWDEEPDNAARPPGLVRLSSTTLNISTYLLDQGSTFGNGTATHNLALYRHPGGALVFGAGTTRWSWGLDGSHDSGPSTPDVRMRQATVNLLADMGVQPSTLQSGLVATSASSDFSSPISTIVSPADGGTVAGASAATISGTASDSGGGVVGMVDVSTDGGATWHHATGRQNWTYSWTTTTIGPVNIRSRAADDSGNVETPSAGITANVASLVVTFNELAPNQDLNGVYPANEINWGTGRWWASGPWGAFATNSTSFSGPGSTSESFTFVTPRRLVSMVAYNGGTASSTVTLSCAGNPTRNFSVGVGEVKSLSVSWSALCGAVTVSSSNGWNTNFDDIQYDTGSSCAGVVCTASDACHVAGTCNPANGTCSNPTAPNGTACNDGSACTQSDSCQSGVCTGSSPVVCTASDACHVAGTCNPANGTCSNPTAPNGTVCNDGNATTCGDVCSSGVCGGSFVAEPPEIDSSVRVGKSGSDVTISWSDAPGPYNVYRGSISPDTPWSYSHTCFSAGLSLMPVTEAQDPSPGTLFYYVVSRIAQCRESILGRDGTGAPIPNPSACSSGPP